MGDGTAESYLHVEQPLSSKLLHITEEDVDLLKSTSYRTGQIQYHRNSGNKEVSENGSSCNICNT